MKNVLIDPYMFELSEVQEIKDNIYFFQELIQLCGLKRIVILLYQGLYERITEGTVHPFPVDVSILEDSVLREKARIINGSFRYALLNRGQPVEISDCFDKANLTTGNREIDEDPLYYEMLSVLMKPCYSREVLVIEKNIITGKKKKGLNTGTLLSVECKCDTNSFNREYIFSGIRELYSEKDCAFSELQEQVRKGICTFCEVPEVIRGDHHNHVQGKDFDRYDQLTRRNRNVLNLLRFFGMKKIIFEDFHPDFGKPVGDIKVKLVQKTDTQDIVRADIYVETGFRYGVRIFFPKQVGENLYKYLDGEFSYQKVERLKSLLGLLKK